MKNWLLPITSILFIAALIWVVFFSGWRLIQTVYLITRISPFERVIEGAPIILVMGDSTAYGTGVRRNEESIAGLIAADWPDYSVLTRAGNGWNTHSLRQRLPQLLVVDERYMVVVLQIGANDIIQGRSLADSQADLVAIFSELKNHTEHIVWLHSGDIGGATGFTSKRAQALSEKTEQFRDMAKALAEDHGVHYIDLWREASVDPFRQKPERYLARDGLHLSAAGYAKWYEEIRKALVPLIDLPRE